jgi:ribose-phosphate pyrophosphokinase
VKLAICPLPGNEQFARRLRERLAAEALGLEWRRFPDGESYVRFTGACEGRDLALVCTLNDPDPKIMTLLFAAHTARELGARSVGLVAPYLAYMRQDRRFHDGEAVTSTHFAVLLSSSLDWLVTVDPHLHRHGTLSEIYPIRAKAASAAPALAAWIRANVERPLVVGPDAESEQWASEIAEGAQAPYAVLSKTRRGDRDVEIKAPPLERWKGFRAVLIDDIISSARTMAVAAKVLAGEGMAEPICLGVHAVFSAGSLEALRAAGVSRVVTTNTIQHETSAIDVSAPVAQAIEEILPALDQRPKEKACKQKT